MSGTPGSLRTRLLVRIGAALVAVCAAMALAAVLAQRALLLDHLDGRVMDAAEHGLARSSLRPGDDRDLTFPDGNGHPDGLLAARLDAHGAVTAAAVTGPGSTPRTLTAGQRAALRGIAPDGTPHTRTVPGLGTYRVTGLDASGVRVLAGLPMDDVRDVLNRLVVVEAVVGAAGLAVAGCVCAVVVRRQLRPLGRVAATAADLARVPLGHDRLTGLPRVPEADTGPGSEAGQVGAALNRMIDQVETDRAARRRGEERMRRFLADAGHELRTPLASIAGYAELMNRGTGPVEPMLAWRRVSAESARMTGLVEDLLLLARLDEGRPPRSAEVDLVDLVAEAVREARAADPERTWRLAPHLDAPALVIGDATGLGQAVANLLANAHAHTPPGTTVVAAVEATAERRVIRVRDDGPGIPPHLLASVFDRFTRADASRSRRGPGDAGSGLGLAVVEAIAAAHGGRTAVRSAPGHTEFTVELPPATETEGELPLPAEVSGLSEQR
ncbi:sensor histidine kinase [Streptomyces violarus]|uniref:histidine kinase n=1 Tax=Streptomyces violarus TaxID=67380 RepID=A0A7W5F0K0_9ACTN|nr:MULTISPECIES: HAMP domain-containing sensor histidine kinase [Streptomyces]MBB3075348.1 two-component system OmpR family sensor kinase [Streptomyces violarus]WRT97959.1 HAMP domain-containing sensor histidine kinase [Streptomyces sp. CGMCC 4.1772]GHD03383.1 sensor histidine kinase [Streptomyces violarus]